MPPSVPRSFSLLFAPPVATLTPPAANPVKSTSKPSVPPKAAPQKRVRTPLHDTSRPSRGAIAAVDEAIKAGALGSLPSLVEQHLGTLSYASILRAIQALNDGGQWKAVLGIFELAKGSKLKARFTSRIYNELFLAMLKVGGTKIGRRGYEEWKEVVDCNKDEMLLTPRAFNLLFVLMSKGGMVDEALQVKENCVQNGYYLNRYSYNAFLNACAKSRRIACAFETLREMAESNVLPDVVSFNVLIACCVKSGELDMACGVLKRMKDWGVDPDVYSYNGIVNGMRKARMMEEAFELVAFMERESGEDVVVTDIPSTNGGRQMGQRSSCIEELTKTAESMVIQGRGAGGVKPDLVTYNTLISGLAGVEPPDFERADAVQKHMEEKGIMSNEVTYNALMAVAARANFVSKAFEVYDEMISRGIRPNCECFTTLITLCGRAKLMERAFEIHRHMQASGVSPSVITYNALLTACRWSGNEEGALNVLKTMREEGCVPDVISYSTVIDMLGRSGQFGVVKSVLEDMVREGIKPNLVTYTSLISALARNGDVKGAMAVLEDMERHGIRANVYTFSTLLHGTGMGGDMRKMFEILDIMRKRGVRPNRVTYTTLLKVAVLSGNREVMNEVLGYLREDERLWGTKQLMLIERLGENLGGKVGKRRKIYEKMVESLFECIEPSPGRGLGEVQPEFAEQWSS